MGFFSKKEEQQPQPRLGPPQIQRGPPTDRVLELKRQGLTNSRIIDTLQREGVDMTQIFDAMNQAEMKTGVGMGPNKQQQIPSDMIPPGAKDFPGGNVQSIVQQPMDQGMDYNNGDYGNDYGSPQSSDMGVQQGMQSGGDIGQIGLERIEELAEAIIDEKWNEIVKSINKIIDWKDRTETRILNIEQSLQQLNTQFDTLHKGVLGKIGEYDKNLTVIGSDIKAMEKVFSKVLPVMTENINELSRITDDIKKSRNG